jgi:copper chaperone CopZ
MAQQSLTFQGVKTVEQVNKITTALMMLEGVDSAEVGRHGADVDGRAKRETLINAVEKLKLDVKVS